MAIKIKNSNQLAVTASRKNALAIISAGLAAVATTDVLKKQLNLNGPMLTVKNHAVNLDDYKRVFLIGIGKAANEAALFLESILGNKITDGVVLDLKTERYDRLQSYAVHHPRPSSENIAASKKIVELSRGISSSDLVLAVVSGGGSAMLCWPETECDDSIKLYDAFLRTGGNIRELNTVRKHISGLKGGGLAQLFYPARILGFIFCDIAGNHYDEVASGPTYLDKTTLADAEDVIRKYSLPELKLNETPKEERYFANITNIPLVSNETALKAMTEKAAELGLKPTVVSAAITAAAPTAAAAFREVSPNYNAVLGGGEIAVAVKQSDGTGGRNQLLALEFASSLKPGETFVSLASDGLDNSDAAGAIVDGQTLVTAQKLGLDYRVYLEKIDPYDFFLKTGDLIFSGPTGANVADLMLLLRE
ncbi:MAG: DUF4147 domain-containing protein [Patescibacteria group bacterium]